MDIINTLRKPKLYNIAIFDLGGTLIGAYVLADYMDGNPYEYMAMAIIAGIIVHKLLGINTALNYYLGLSPPPTRN